jgi:hypothetical protein
MEIRPTYPFFLEDVTESEGVIIPHKNCCGRIIKKLMAIIFQDITGNSFLGQRFLMCPLSLLIYR